jgi:hypothetical protein
MTEAKVARNVGAFSSTNSAGAKGACLRYYGKDLDSGSSKVTRREEHRRNRSPKGVRATEQEHIQKEINEIATRETTIMRRWKWMMIIALLAGALFFSVGAYFLISRDEEANYNEAVRLVRL